MDKPRTPPRKALVKVTGNELAEGTPDKAKGAAETAVGKTKDTVREAVDKI
jgi:uncharacterized protein YjbJ (UPF0337 family)